MAALGIIGFNPIFKTETIYGNEPRKTMNLEKSWHIYFSPIPTQIAKPQTPCFASAEWLNFSA
jgi:hypothetical protein